MRRNIKIPSVRRAILALMGTEMNYYERIQQAVDYIESRLRDDIELQDVAA